MSNSDTLIGSNQRNTVIADSEILDLSIKLNCSEEKVAKYLRIIYKYHPDLEINKAKEVILKVANYADRMVMAYSAN